MRRAALALAPLSLVLAGVLAGPAYAGHATVHDPAKDVVTFDDHGKAVPTDTDADITRLDTALTHRRLTLTLHLRAVPDQDDGQIFGVVTSKKPVYAVSSLWTGHGTTHRVTIDRYRNLKAKGNGTPVACPGMTSRRTGTTVSVHIPAGCLGKPAWVRTFALAYYGEEADETGLDGKITNGTPPQGPKVHA